MRQNHILGSFTEKDVPTIWPESAPIIKSTGPCEAQREGAVRLAEPYIDRYGKKRATGNKRRLKDSQYFGQIHTRDFVHQFVLN